MVNEWLRTHEALAVVLTLVGTSLVLLAVWLACWERR